MEKSVAMKVSEIKQRKAIQVKDIILNSKLKSFDADKLSKYCYRKHGLAICLVVMYDILKSLESNGIIVEVTPVNSWPTYQMK